MSKNEKLIELMSMFDDENIKNKLSENEYLDFVNKLKDVKEENDKNSTIFAECKILKNEVYFDIEGNSEIRIIPGSKIFEFKDKESLKEIKEEIKKNGYWRNSVNRSKLALPQSVIEETDINPIYFNTNEVIVKINNTIGRFSKTYNCNCENNELNTDDDI